MGRRVGYTPVGVRWCQPWVAARNVDRGDHLVLLAEPTPPTGGFRSDVALALALECVWQTAPAGHAADLVDWAMKPEPEALRLLLSIVDVQRDVPACLLDDARAALAEATRLTMGNDTLLLREVVDHTLDLDPAGLLAAECAAQLAPVAYRWLCRVPDADLCALDTDPVVDDLALVLADELEAKDPSLLPPSPWQGTALLTTRA